MASGEGARWRLPLRRFGESGAGGAELTEGFTLIELMIVLLIIAILLAIGIPTFLSVSHQAQKAQTQSDLNSAIESAQAQYTTKTHFPTTSTPTVAEATFLAALTRTQQSLQFIKETKDPTAGTNQISVFNANTGQLVVFTGRDGDDVCWVAALNEGNTTKLAGVNQIPPGDWFTAYRDPVPGATSSVTAALSAARTFVPSFATISGLT